MMTSTWSCHRQVLTGFVQHVKFHQLIFRLSACSVRAEDSSDSDFDSQASSSHLTPSTDSTSKSLHRSKNLRARCQSNKLRILLVDIQSTKGKSSDVALLADIPPSRDSICATVGMVFDNIEATFEFELWTNYFVTPWLTVKDMTRQQYEIFSLGPLPA